MLYIGIDIAKNKHDFAIIDDSNKTKVISWGKILNNRTDFNKLYSKICSLESDCTKIIIGLESTGHYGDNLIFYLLEKGFNIMRINALLMKRYKENQTLRKTKTDKVDAKFIAHALSENYSGFKPYTLPDYHNDEIKSLTRHRKYLVYERATLKTCFSKLVTTIFPEYESHCGINTDTAYAIFKVAPLPKNIARLNTKKLAELVTKTSRGNYGLDLAERLQAAARQSIGDNNPLKALELKHTIQQIEYITKQIREIDETIEKRCDSSVLTTIPGIGKVLATSIQSEIGDINKFERPSQLQAFSGTAPTTYQSGKLKSCGARMEKRGSSALRQSLYLAAISVSRYDKTFNQYLTKKLSEGKHFKSAIGHVIKKLIRLIYAMLKDNHEYIPAE